MDELPGDTSSERENAGLDQRLARLGAKQRALLEQRLRAGSANGHRPVATMTATPGHCGRRCTSAIIPSGWRCFQRGLRYDKLMETFGGYVEHVEHPGSVGPALERALASARAARINVVIDSDAPFHGD